MNVFLKLKKSLGHRWRRFKNDYSWQNIKNFLYWQKIKIGFRFFLVGWRKGVTAVKRNPRVIVSLTSYPPRIPQIHYTIYSLLNQAEKPDEVILWLAEEQFPNRDADLPKNLLKLLDHGLTIRYCHDIKSYKKLIPMLKEYPHDIVVTFDDDAYYESNTLKRLIHSYQKNGKGVYGHRGHFILFDENDHPASYSNWKHQVSFQETGLSFRNFLTGVGGILYPPNAFHQDVAREELFMDISPTADDIWFWAMAILNDTKICIVENNIAHPFLIPSSEESSHDGFRGLMTVNWGGGGNDRQIRAVLDHYPVILEKLKEEAMDD